MAAFGVSHHPAGDSFEGSVLKKVKGELLSRMNQIRGKLLILREAKQERDEIINAKETRLNPFALVYFATLAY